MSRNTMGSGNMGYPGGPRGGGGGGGMAQYQMNRMQQGGYPGMQQGPYHNARMMPSMNPQMQRHAFVSHYKPYYYYYTKGLILV